MNDRVDEIALREWPPIQKALSASQSTAAMDTFWLWTYRISPGIPVTWPPQWGRSEFDYYLSAAGMNPSLLRDGERYITPWGMVRANSLSQHCEFYGMQWDPNEVRTQGVRPLRSDEVQINQDSHVQEDLAHALADGILPPELAIRVRAYYRLWASTQAIAELIEPRHPTFFSWLREDIDGTRDR